MISVLNLKYLWKLQFQWNVLYLLVKNRIPEIVDINFFWGYSRLSIRDLARNSNAKPQLCSPSPNKFLSGTGKETSITMTPPMHFRVKNLLFWNLFVKLVFIVFIRLQMAMQFSVKHAVYVKHSCFIIYGVVSASSQRLSRFDSK